MQPDFFYHLDKVMVNIEQRVTAAVSDCSFSHTKNYSAHHTNRTQDLKMDPLAHITGSVEASTNRVALLSALISQKHRLQQWLTRFLLQSSEKASVMQMNQRVLIDTFII